LGRVLSTEWLGRRLARASEEEMVQVIDGPNEILGA
jgi:hypothetical protein